MLPIHKRLTTHASRLRKDQRGNIAVMMGLLLPILVGALGLGFEVTDWYMQTRKMQNAADSAALAAADNNSPSYAVEAAAVAAQYGFVSGANNVTVTATNTAPCPSGGSDCYKVTITSKLPLYLSQVVGYAGDGNRQKNLASAAVAKHMLKQQPICLLALNTFAQALTGNGSPNTNFQGCTVMSNADTVCNGSNLYADFGLAAHNSVGCGAIQFSDVPPVSDPYSVLAANLPPKINCPPSGFPTTTWSTSGPPAGTQSSSGGVNYVQVCGNLQLGANIGTSSTPWNPSTPTVLVIENGNLNLDNLALHSKNVTVVFSAGTNGKSGIPTDANNHTQGLLDVQAPVSGPWSAVALYEDPRVAPPNPTSLSYFGNKPAWEISGLTYFPLLDVTLSGVVNKSSNGAQCMVMVASTITVNGTGSFYPQSPAGCAAAGLIMPTTPIPTRAQLVY
jgi:Flp pilus assembly protein TadG